MVSPEEKWNGLSAMGFSYQDWNGVFYPAEMAARNYLVYYNRIFNRVEIAGLPYELIQPPQLGK